MSTAQPLPIIYTGDIDVRFGDLDPYGHLNAKHYLDIVATARLRFLACEMKCPVEQLVERGIGFYLKKATQNFQRPIPGIQRVHQRSYVSAVNGAVLVIPYELMSEDKTIRYADGVLEYAVVDLKLNRPTEPPPWLLQLFFHN